MSEFLYVCLYVFIGTIVGGTSYAITKRKGDVTPEINLILGSILWPLALVVFLSFGMAKLADYILYSKQDRIKKVADKLKYGNITWNP